eukprot:Lankesteria_metandrocarpae@DN9493_c0_g1_i1.p1
MSTKDNEHLQVTAHTDTDRCALPAVSTSVGHGDGGGRHAVWQQIPPVPPRHLRITNANADGNLCPTYPAQLIVPVACSDELLFKVAAFRSKCRIPILSWCDAEGTVGLWRCSQPKSAFNRSTSDEYMLCNLTKHHCVPTTVARKTKKLKSKVQTRSGKYSGTLSSRNIERHTSFTSALSRGRQGAATTTAGDGDYAVTFFGGSDISHSCSPLSSASSQCVISKDTLQHRSYTIADDISTTVRCIPAVPTQVSSSGLIDSATVAAASVLATVQDASGSGDVSVNDSSVGLVAQQYSNEDESSSSSSSPTNDPAIPSPDDRYYTTGTTRVAQSAVQLKDTPPPQQRQHLSASRHASLLTDTGTATDTGTTSHMPNRGRDNFGSLTFCTGTGTGTGIK